MLSVNPAFSGSSASSANDSSNIAAFVSQNTIGILALVPSRPTSVVATSGNTQLAVTWTAPANTGGSAITNYLVKYSSNNGVAGSWTRYMPGSPITATSCTVTGLTNGTAYVIKVIARNSVGISLPSANSAPATPAATVPGSPTSVVATSGNTSLAVTWTAPTSTGGSNITNYLVKYSSNNGVAGSWTRWGKTTVITATACTVTGLANGTAYVIKVVAQNAVGTSPSSANSAPATPLGAALTPAFGSTTATANGFTVQVTNYSSAYTWAGTATASGSVAISSTGLVTVTGVAARTSSTATITTTRTGYTGGSNTVTATSLAAANLTSTTLSITQTWAQEPSGYSRTAAVLVPTSGSGPYPVVIMLHGNEGDSTFINSMGTALNSAIRVAPNGYATSWNVDNETSKAPDVAFIRDLITRLKTYNNVDAGKISIYGSSNGSGMTNRLLIELDTAAFQKAACRVSQMITDMYHDGSFWFNAAGNNTYDQTITPASGRKIISISGTADTIIPYTGGIGAGTTFMDCQESVYRFAQQMGETGPQLSDAAGIPGNGTNGYSAPFVKYAYLSGQVVHYKLIGGNHGLRVGSNTAYATEANQLIATFLLG